MATADVLVSTIVMGGLLLIVTVIIQRARDWHGYTVAVSNSGISTGRTNPDAVPPEANTSDSVHPIRFILGVILLVGAITALINVRTTTGLLMEADINVFFVFVYLGLVAVTTPQVIWT